MRFATFYACVAVIFLALDMLWLGLVARRFYKEQLGALLLEQPKLGPAALFYAIYVAGIVLFAIRPDEGATTAMRCLLLGAALGCVAYAAYDLSNLATIKGFPATLAIVDLIWGTALTALSAAGGYLIATRLLGA